MPVLGENRILCCPAIYSGSTQCDSQGDASTMLLMIDKHDVSPATSFLIRYPKQIKVNTLDRRP